MDRRGFLPEVFPGLSPVKWPAISGKARFAERGLCRIPQKKVFFDRFRASIDSIRCIIAILCYIFLLFGAFLIIFRKENQCAEIEENVDYIDWEEDYDSLPMPEIYGLTVSEPIEENYYQNAFLKETGNSSFRRKKRENDDKRMEEDKGNEEDEEENTETELLVDFSDHSVAYLESEFSGERIYLKKFPFLIGKLKKGTDYVLENFSDSFDLAKRICQEFEKNIQKPFPNIEISYFAIHIERVKSIDE